MSARVLGSSLTSLTSLTSLVSAVALCACDAPSAPATDAGPTPRDAGADAGPREWPAMDVPAVTTPESGIVREVLRVPGFTAPANPTTGDATPAELNATQVVRYRASPEVPPRAVVVCVPGFLGGAGSFDGLARNLVRGSVARGTPVEVWAIDRRSAALEDLRGMNTAEASADTDAARGYYFGRDTIDGTAFPGFLDQTDVPYMSEWGLETHVEDLRLVIERVPEVARVGHVFLLGHSLGGSFAETFAAWRFDDGTPDGLRGAEMLAGVILVDGAQSETPIDETTYRTGGGSGFMTTSGVEGIRSADRYVALPLLGVTVYARAEIVALDALFSPDAVRTSDRGRDMVLGTLLGLSIAAVPAMTNEAALGWAFDDASNALAFAAVSCGESTGGAIEEYDGLLGGRQWHPSDPDATYAWLDATESDPAELTPIAALAHSWTDGRTNFGEWYFPQRLPHDLGAVAGLDVPAGDYRLAEFDLRASDGALMDAPVLAIAAGLVGVSGYTASRARGAPIGAGRPNAGAPRTADLAYRVLDATHMTHIDPLSAAEGPMNPVPSVVLDFVEANAAPGTFTPMLPSP